MLIGFRERLGDWELGEDSGKGFPVEAAEVESETVPDEFLEDEGEDKFGSPLEESSESEEYCKNEFKEER